MVSRVDKAGRQAWIQIYTTDRRDEEREVESADLGFLLVKLHPEEALDSFSLMPW